MPTFVTKYSSVDRWRFALHCGRKEFNKFWQETLDNPQAMILVCIFLSGVFSAIGMILFFGKQIHMTVSCEFSLYISHE